MGNCDNCGKKKRTRKFTRKQLRGLEQKIEEKIIQTKDEPYIDRKLRWLKKKVGADDYINSKIKELEKKHQFKRKSKLCYECQKDLGLIDV